MSREHGQATIGGPKPRLRPESLDQVFDALADERRRVAVMYLADADRGVARDELAREVAGETLDHRTLDGPLMERVETELHHRHLPKLAAAGLVDYDEDRGVVYATEIADRVTGWLAAV